MIFLVLINYIYNMKKLLLLTSASMLFAFSGWAQKIVAGTVQDDGGLLFRCHCY